jgi:hypothetical protein
MAVNWLVRWVYEPLGAEMKFATYGEASAGEASAAAAAAGDKAVLATTNAMTSQGETQQEGVPFLLL